MPTHLYATDACQDRYCLDRVIGERTWHGTADDIDVITFVQSRRDDIAITFETARNENGAIKYYFELEVRFYRVAPDGDDNVQHTTARFYIPPMTSDVDNLDLADIVRQFMEKIDSFSDQLSGWSIAQMNFLRLCWGRYRPLVAGTFIPTPKFIADKKAVVNIQCHDDENCFQYSVLCGMNIINTSANKSRPSLYKPYLNMLNMDGIQTPVPLSSIDKFEMQNPDVSVNVLYLDERDIVPIRTSKFNQRKYHVNLLMLTNEDKFHYVSVQSLSRLVAHRTKHKCKMHVCQFCLYPFSKMDLLDQHLPECSHHHVRRPPQQILYQKKHMIKFNKFDFQFQVPFVVYANFELFFTVRHAQWLLCSSDN